MSSHQDKRSSGASSARNKTSPSGDVPSSGEPGAALAGSSNRGRPMSPFQAVSRRGFARRAGPSLDNTLQEEEVPNTMEEGNLYSRGTDDAGPSRVTGEANAPPGTETEIETNLQPVTEASSTSREMALLEAELRPASSANSGPVGPSTLRRKEMITRRLLKAARKMGVTAEDRWLTANMWDNCVDMFAKSSNGETIYADHFFELDLDEDTVLSRGYQMNLDIPVDVICERKRHWWPPFALEHVERAKRGGFRVEDASSDLRWLREAHEAI